MLKKLFIGGGVVLYSFSSFGSETKQTEASWEMGDNRYRITLERVYTENIATAFNNILNDFQSQNSKAFGGDLHHYNAPEDHGSTAKKSQKSRVDLFKNGENSLLLLHRRAKKGENTSLFFQHEEEIVGGAYLSFEEKGKTIRLNCDGYSNLPFTELSYAKKRVLEELWSSKNFPKAQRLIIFSKAYSMYSCTLRILGFKESTYTDKEHPIDQYTSFEIAMS